MTFCYLLSMKFALLIVVLVSNLVLIAGTELVAVCPIASCLGQPSPRQLCPDGSSVGSSGRCIRQAFGRCGWELAKCPCDCGPRPAMNMTLCPDGQHMSGSTGKCLRFQNTCRWEVLDCPPSCADFANDPQRCMSKGCKMCETGQCLSLNDTCPALNPCHPNPCKNNGVCTSTPDGFACECTPAWTGTKCNKNKNACKNNNSCTSGGDSRAICIDSPAPLSGFSCMCSSMYKLQNHVCVPKYGGGSP